MKHLENQESIALEQVELSNNELINNSKLGLNSPTSVSVELHLAIQTAILVVLFALSLA